MSVIQEGQLKGAFRGFHNRETIFEFCGGGKWRQNEYKYRYHYLYMPWAKAVAASGRVYLQVDGIDDTVDVVRQC